MYYNWRQGLEESPALISYTDVHNLVSPPNCTAPTPLLTREATGVVLMHCARPALSVCTASNALAVGVGRMFSVFLFSTQSGEFQTCKNFLSLTTLFPIEHTAIHHNIIAYAGARSSVVLGWGLQASVFSQADAKVRLTPFV